MTTMTMVVTMSSIKRIEGVCVCVLVETREGMSEDTLKGVGLVLELTLC